MSRDKGSLAEQQTKENRNNNDTDKEKTQHEPQKPQTRSPKQDRRRALPSLEWVPAALPPVPPPEPSVMAHGMEYRALFGQVGVGPAHPACPFLDSGEN